MARSLTVAADMEYAASIDVQSTPAYLINERLIPGAQPIGNFKEIIEHELALAGQSEKQGAGPSHSAERPWYQQRPAAPWWVPRRRAATLARHP